MEDLSALLGKNEFEQALRAIQRSFPDYDESRYSEIATRRKYTSEEISELEQEESIALVHVLVRALRWLEPPILSINDKLAEKDEMRFPFEDETNAIYERGKELDLWE